MKLYLLICLFTFDSVLNQMQIEKKGNEFFVVLDNNHAIFSPLLIIECFPSQDLERSLSFVCKTIDDNIILKLTAVSDNSILCKLYQNMPNGSRTFRYIIGIENDDALSQLIEQALEKNGNT